MIPLKSLRRVCEGCQKHVLFLLQEATKQHNTENYSLGIFLTIIALEETSKLAVYSDHLRQLKSVSSNMEKNLTKHNYKIFKLFKTELENHNLSKKTNLLIPIMLGSLNFVKQFILYYDTISDTNMTLQEHFLKHDVTKNNLGHYAVYLWKFTHILFHSELLKAKYAKTDGIIYSDSNVFNSGEYKILKNEIDSFTNLTVSGSEEKARFVIDELKMLAKKFNMFYDFKKSTN